MVATVMIGNLPPGTTEQEVIEELTENGWPSVTVSKVDEGNPESLLFTVQTDMDPAIARSVAERYANKGNFKGRRMDIYVPLAQ